MKKQLIDIDYENMSMEDVEKLLREAGYETKLVGKYFQLVADYAILEIEVDRLRNAIRVAAESAYISDVLETGMEDHWIGEGKEYADKQD